MHEQRARVHVFPYSALARFKPSVIPSPPPPPFRLSPRIFFFQRIWKRKEGKEILSSPFRRIRVFEENISLFCNNRCYGFEEIVE